MTTCRQLNYLRKKSDYGDYSDELVADGEVGGRNWSFIERTWKRASDARWRGGKYHYLLRIDVSEYENGYRRVFHSPEYNDLQAALAVRVDGLDVLRFSVSNQSPGIWENGFNPNYWLEARVMSYEDDEDRLRRVIATGFDMRDLPFIGIAARSAVEALRPAVELFRAAAPAGTPYNYWWGSEAPPPPRKPVY